MYAQEDDITSLLPNEATSTSRAEPSVQMYDCLDIHSPAFLTSHPPAMVRSVQLMFKSLVLLGRINSCALVLCLY